MNRISRWLGVVGCALAGFSPGAGAQEFFPTGSEWRYLKGTAPASAPDPIAWRSPGFDDSSWARGAAAFYYGDPFSGTRLTDMQNNYSTLFLRQQFTVANPGDIKALLLRAACDDGFICWINGREVMRFNMPAGEVPFNGFASGPANPDPAVFNDYPLPGSQSFLVPGVNHIAVQVANATLGSSDLAWDAALTFEGDFDAPVAERVAPPVGAAVRELYAVEVLFSEPVAGVEAADLLINDRAATNVVEVTPGQFVFSFPKAAPGNVTVAFRADHGITDRAGTPHPFAGGAWNYTVDPNLRTPGLIISEFLADNDGVNRDEDGDESDWIELFNASPLSVSLFGWALTDDATDLAKWRFPALTLPPGGRLLVFASEKNRTATTGRLHTNFKLSTTGEFLALVNPAGEVESAFAPVYPAQRKNVSFGRANGVPNLVGYFTTPTPGAANSSSGAGFAPDVKFSVNGGAYRANFTLSLALQAPNPAAVIRYTLNGALPTEASPVYSAPIPISGSVNVRARTFAPGLLPGDPHGEMFLKLEGTTPTFSSDLPVMVLHNFGKSRPPSDGQQSAYLQVYEPINGVTSLTNPPTLSSRVGIGARGSSTLGYPKVSLNLELRDEFEADRDQELLGLPEDSDWVLYAPNNFEPILIHNPFAHQLSRDLGRYSSRTRFVELYLITDAAGTVRYPDNYAGIYVLEERIRRSPDRVAVDKLEPEHSRAPQITGGYLLKVDRPGPGEGGFIAANQSLAYVEPSEVEINQPERTAQRDYLQSYFDAFGNALYNEAIWKNPVTGYRAYIDVDAWVDHSLLNVLTLNVDALRLSAYLYKPRNGKITFGPLWDFDRALNSTDGRDANPRVWRSEVGDRGTDFFNETTQAWWGRLFQDPDFFQLWIDRYQALRRNHFATTNLWRLVDQLTSEVRRAQPREQTKWSLYASPRGGYQNEITMLKAWLSNRVSFMDSQFVAPPTHSVPGGLFVEPLQVRLTSPANGTIYYTLDGTDPRLPGGGVRGTAKIATANPIPITANTRLVARVNNNAHTARTGDGNPPLISKWSGSTAATYFNVVPSLLFTEIMFHPAAAPAGSTNTDLDFEFVELKNTSTAPLNLTGFSLSGGIQYTFTAASGVTSLDPGARVLLVRNRAAFLARYPGTTGLAGEFTGDLSNRGNRLVLLGPLQEPISDFAYEDAWAPLADGVGFSLVLRNEDTAPGALGQATAWRQSARAGGSPGAADPTPTVVAEVFVNEALPHTDPPLLDAIELFNPGAAPVAVGGWWLSDDFRTPAKFRIPAGTTVAAGGHWVVDEAQFRAGATGFSFSAFGDEVHLFSADATGELTGWHHGFGFGASFNGVSFGRHVSSDAAEHFVPQVRRSLGAANAGPKVGPLVITEIHAEPTPAGPFNNTADEFVEIRNITVEPLPLFDPLHATNRWHLRGGVDFDFPAGMTLPPGGFALVVGFDPAWPSSPEAAFRAAFNVPAEVPIVGPWSGTLNNSGESLALNRPDEPVLPPAASAGDVPYVNAETIRYRPVSPWPTETTGTGKSLQRLRSVNFGNEPANWQAALPTAGRQNHADDTLSGPADTDTDGLPDEWETQFGLNPGDNTGADGADGDPDGDGQSNRDEFVAGTHPQRASSVFRAGAGPFGDGVGIQFQTVAGRSYTVWVRDSLSGGDWQVLTHFGLQNTASLLTAADFSGLAPRFYRVTVAGP
jgi:hypothetical protein